MSTVTLARGSACNSAQLQRAVAPSTARNVKLQSASDARGVGPADRTGKSRVSYWPGGRRLAAAPTGRRPLKPREMLGGGMQSNLSVTIRHDSAGESTAP